MARLRGVVLAAGRGVRMGGAGPKTLLPVDGRGPLLGYILDGLRHAGVDDLLVITGYKPQELHAFVTERWGADGVTFLRNPRFASWGNFHSLRLAVDQSPGMQILVVNSDVVLAPDVYRRVVDSGGDLVLAVERRTRLDEEDMRVQLKGTTLLDIGKDLRMGRSHGEFAGLSLLRPVAARVYSDLATELEWRAETHIYYEDVFRRMLPFVDARAAFVDEGEYAEVDEPADVEGAAAVIDTHWSPAASER